MEEKVTLSTGLKVWLWIVFVVNIISAIGALVSIFGAAAISAAYGLGAGYTILCVLSFLLEIALLVGVAMMLFKQKKLGFYIICGTAVAVFILNLVTYGMLGALTAGNFVRALIYLIVSPLITYLFARADWDKLN